MKQLEHNLQCAAVRYFRYKYPQFAPLLFSVPNGGHRALSTAIHLKAEGAQAGVSDLILLVPNKEFHGLCLEMKVKPNKPTEAQIKWMQAATSQGYKCAVCYSFDEFERVVTEYLMG